MKRKEKTVPIRITDETLALLDQLGWIKEISVTLNAKGTRRLDALLKAWVIYARPAWVDQEDQWVKK